MNDLRTAYRSLMKSPTFTAVATTVMALGIGAGSAIFSIVDAVVLRALPFDEHDRLVAVLEWDTTRAVTFGNGTITPQTYIDWRTQQEVFETLAAAGSWTYPMRTETGEPADVRGYRVTSDFLPMLRVNPILGRHFTADDERFGQHRVVLLSHGFWQRRFGGAADIVGKSLEVNNERWEIVGVLPREFGYPVASDRPTELYTPIAFRPEDRVRQSNRNYNWTAIGRLKKGVSIQQAQDQMSRVTEALDRQYPAWGPGRRAQVFTLHHHLVGRVRPWLLMLLGAVSLVLLIACANVANLMLARSTARTREMGVRAALGASRWRLVRGLLAEGLLLSLSSAAIGIVLANLGIEAIRAWMPPNVPRVAQIGLDLRVLAATVIAALATGVTFGLVPAFQSARPDLTTALKDTGRSATAGRRTQRLRGALVVGEIALAVVLLVGAGLFIGSFRKLTSIDLGFDYRHLIALNVNVNVVDGRFDLASKQGAGYVERMQDVLRQVPGVTGVEAVAGGMPIAGGWSRTGLQLPNGQKFEGAEGQVDRRSVTPGYLSLMKIALVRGRYPTASDGEASQKVAVINETAAAKYWPGRDPIGERFTMNSHERTVVGLVRDIRHLGPEQPARPEVYVPMRQEGSIGATLAIRTGPDPLTMIPAVKTAIWSVNRDQRLSSEIVTLEGHLERMLAQRRFNMALLVLFGGLGLIIAAVGIYGVMAYLVAQRTNEIGVRMALGATRGNVVAMILRRASGLTIAGLALGTLVAWPLGRYFQVESFLFQIEPTDAVTYVAALGVLAAAGLAASAIPAHRAASIDPLTALRHE